MKKQTLTKIISGLIVFVFVVSMFQFALPIQAATESSMSSLYSNPNQSGNNTYKFKIKDVVNSSLLTNIVGCTGVVSKVAGWMAKFIQSPAKQAAVLEDEAAKILDQMKSACKSGKAASETSGQAIVGIGGLAKPIGTFLSMIGIKIGTDTVKTCQDAVDATSIEQVKAMKKQTDQEAEVAIKEQCFDGIAITLAKNQLTAMTRSAMNWVNSGYGGNPFFVQNMQNLTRNIEKNVLETGEDILLDKAFGGKNKNPYAQNFLESTANVQNLRSSSTKFLGGLTSDLSNFISDPNSYFDENNMSEAERTQQALHRAQVANDAFARDFSVGGWNGWLALTQKPQNNPLGFNMIASQYLADVQAQQKSEIQSELTQNNGFLNQKECVKWNDDDLKKLKDQLSTVKDQATKNCEQYPDTNLDDCVALDTTPIQAKIDSFKRECLPDGWKITTPGSIIKDKVTGYLGSPERQLELAKTINDSLNALFSVLIDKLAGGGLSSLSDSANNSSNWTDTMNNLDNYVSPDGNTTYDNNGAYDGFNLTRDLGNNYIYTDPTDLGTWNASTNEATNELYKDFPTTFPANVKTVKLYPETSPENYQDNPDTPAKELELVNPVNAYYKVTTTGNTKLMVEGYNGWAKDDRAFWDGSKWQNWKCYKSTSDKTGPCDNQINPIKKRGVIQVQQDYIVAGKEILKVLPSIMPKLGELDYCLPGPNPSYKTNSADAQSAYQSWIGSMYVGPRDMNRDEWRIDHEDSQTYKNLANIFKDNPQTWAKLLDFKNGPIINSDGVVTSLGDPMFLIDGFDRNWLSTKDKIEVKFSWKSALGLVGLIWSALDGDTDVTVILKGDCVSGGGTSGSCQNYHYHKDGKSLGDPEQSNVDNRKQLMTGVLDYVNNKLFQDFYTVFDKMMNDIYFKKMTSKYNDNELIIGQDENKAYVEMAAAGLDLTKNIMYYNDDIAKATKDYTDAITQAKINIAKLEPIRKEVSEIILAAQNRRNDNLTAQINKEGGTAKDRTAICNAYKSSCGDGAILCQATYNECIVANGKDLTSVLYKKIYASCLAEENISFYDPEQLTKGGEAGSCSDGIDNDVNGLVDMKDPACSPPSVSVNANINVNYGGSSIITWNSTNATECTLSGGKFIGNNVVKGTSTPAGVSTGPLTTTTSYVVSCIGTNGLLTSAGAVVTVVNNNN